MGIKIEKLSERYSVSYGKARIFAVKILMVR
jgi:hypothetical protein